MLLALVEYFKKGTQIQQYADSAIAEIKILLKESENEDHRVFSAMGSAYALSQEPDSAMLMMQKALDLLPFENDAIAGYGLRNDLAYVYLLNGQNELALEQMEWLLSNNGNNSLSVELIKMRRVIYNKVK